jgi:RNA polymerase sigma-54 factor
VDDKWIQTPRGLLPLKRFFGGGTRTSSGEEVAYDQLRLRLQEMIAQEDKRKPLSDEEIVKAFEKEGITLARRTVTKYRETLGIPSSRQRRVY